MHGNLPVNEYAIFLLVTRRDTGDCMAVSYDQEGFTEQHARDQVDQRMAQFFPSTLYTWTIHSVEHELSMIDRKN